jgi:hypothetical protein
VKHAKDPRNSEIVEEVLDQRLDGLDGITFAPVIPYKGVTDLGSPRLVAQVKCQIAEYLPCIDVANHGHPPLIVLRPIHNHQLCGESLGLFHRVGNAPILIAGDLGVVASLRKADDVARLERTNLQARGSNRGEHPDDSSSNPGRKHLLTAERACIAPTPASHFVVSTRLSVVRNDRSEDGRFCGNGLFLEFTTTFEIGSGC